MRQPDNTRSYQSFPSVIPVCRASSLRVTHPSALARLRKRSFANDLHVLSILSAFILSQDQTLHSIYFSHIFFFSPFFRPLTEISLYSKPLRIFASSSYSVSHCPRLPLRLTKIILPNLFPFVNTFFYLFFLFFIPPLLLYPSITPFMHYISSTLLFLNTICCFVPLFLFFVFFFCFSFCLFFKAFRVFLFDYLNLL